MRLIGIDSHEKRYISQGTATQKKKKHNNTEYDAVFNSTLNFVQQNIVLKKQHVRKTKRKATNK